MRTYVTLLSVLLAALCPLSALSQDSRISTTTEILPDGHVRFVVTNTSTQPITALYVVAEGTPLVSGISRTVSHRFFDSSINIFSEKNLLAQEDRVFTLAGPNPGPTKMRTSVELEAALFSDGSSWGDPSTVQRLIDRRKSMLRFVSTALKALQDASASGLSREQLTQQFQALRDSVSSLSHDRDERPFALGVYDEVLDNLQIDKTLPTGGLPLDRRIGSITSQLIQRQQKLLASKPSLVQNEATASLAP